MMIGDRFRIDLANGPSGEASGISLHFSPRADEKQIVLNDCKAGGEWGKEERKKLTIKKEEPFDIRIRAHESKFEVFVDHKELCEFEYRQPLSSVNHLVIDGDVKLHAVNWGGKYYPVPYQAGIDGGFKPGKKLYVSGILEEKGKDFSINILDNHGKILFHLAPRFNEKAIVRNSKIGDTWDKEEREGKFVLEKKKSFDIIIANESYAFQVYIDGHHYCAFAHRADPNAGAGLQIQGDVELQGVHVK
jgi:hypothetical protein